ncbi:cation diffusion facilitator family transporter [Crenobacter sp. SG2303]|uniref:Cation diffusion facilitator family transporter n=1 Tax=Crenobacter oryzisoli TaxID=3056844 RepID=A0ABT7XIS8_9NEIS|nr:cation diffusion facilitator family transporter [Crenobacter sp. SG2303]MDN0073686.1 cation diffusion facilitator family transporter [Crenobacter sp. SG2303]
MPILSPDTDRQFALDKQQAAKRSTLVSVAVNLALSACQIVIGTIAHSSALIADGVHSLSDLVSDFVVLYANKHSHKAADSDHQYGHARFETAASLAIGVLLLVVGVGMLWAAAMKFEDPSKIPTVHFIALWMALTTLGAKEGLFRYMLAVARRVKSSMLIANAWHARSDAASSLVVAIGIVGNLMGLPLLDPLAAAIVGFMISRTGWNFSREALNDLMDRALDEQQVKAIRATLAETEGIRNVHDLRTRKMGDLAVVDAHLLVDSHLSVSEGHQLALKAHQRVSERFPVVTVTLHIDADPDQNADDPSLPSRRALLDMLNSRLGVPLAFDDLRAHYLGGKIELEIYVDDDDAAREVELRRAAATLPQLRSVQLFQRMG